MQQNGGPPCQNNILAWFRRLSIADLRLGASPIITPMHQLNHQCTLNSLVAVVIIVAGHQIKHQLEALFYVALLILTLITLALALVLRESPFL